MLLLKNNLYNRNIINVSLKRLFDLFFSFLFLVVVSPILFVGYIVASWDTRANGIFTQQRVGQYAKLFTIYKFRTIHPKTRKISKTGKFLRRSKIDELPQLVNVLKGEMSFVGPRPDLPGYYDTLTGEDRKVLELKPGITSEASIKYAAEEVLLAAKENPLKYNDEVLFPDKVKMNLDYYHRRSFWLDLQIMLRTVWRK